MTATSLGIWKAYRPSQPPAGFEVPEGMTMAPGQLSAMFANVVFMRNAAGDDWYDYVKTLDAGVTYVLADKDGVVRSASNDPTMFNPRDMELFQLDTEVEDFNDLYFKNVSEL